MKKIKKILTGTLSCGLAASMTVTPVFAQENSEGASLTKWCAVYGEAGGTSSVSPDSLNDGVMLLDNTILMAGTFDGSKTPDKEGVKGKTDGALVLYDDQGNMIWEKLTGGSKADSFNGAAQTGDGGFIAVGNTQSVDGDLEGQGKGAQDGLAALFDGDGNLKKAVALGGSNKDGFNDVFVAQDGGFVAVGYTHSTDGDLAGKTQHGARDAWIVKLDSNLNIEWSDTFGGSGSTLILDEFTKGLTCHDGGFLAVGYSQSSDGDMEGAAKGGKDAVLVKYDSEGSREFQKVYGGTGDEAFTHVEAAHLNRSGSADREEADTDQLDGGFVLTGYTSSKDGDMDGLVSGENTAENAFVMEIDKKGNVEWIDVMESSQDSGAYGVQPISDGFLVTGDFSANDGDFTGTDLFGKQDNYIAHYSQDGKCRAVYSFGGNDTDGIKGILSGFSDDYLVWGSTKSTDSIFEGKTKGGYDGFLVRINAHQAEAYDEEKYLVPVTAWKADEDTPSMMAPMLYKNAYVTKSGSEIKATLYFTNAQLMGSQVNASTLGDVSYEYKGEMIPAETDRYDEKTQVKTVVIKVDSLEEPVPLHIEDTMGDIRISFSPDEMEKTDTPPYFEEVVVDAPDFEAAWKTSVGGSDVDYSNDMTVLNNGDLIVAGQTYSNDGDFEGQLKGASSAFISRYDSSGKLLHTQLLGGTRIDSYDYASSVAALEDGGYVVAGGYQEGDGVDPTGDFAQLKTDGSVHGGIDGFLAKYDKDNNLVWMKNFSGSEHDQIKQIRATKDGGIAALVETLSNDGDMQDLNKGLFDVAVVKYDKDGNLEWIRSIGGVNLESAGFGIDIMADGSYIVGGHTSSGSGDFAGTDYYGDIFDIFAAQISPEGELLWIRTYGGDKSEYCNSIIATEDGGFLLSGDTKSTTGTFAGIGTGYDNAFIIKCDGSGKVEWTDIIKSSETSEISSALETDYGYVFTGYSRGTDFDFEGISKGSADAFVAVYDKDGKRKSLENIGGSLADYGAQLARLNDYQISILVYGESADGDFTGVSRGGYDGLLLTYDDKERPEEPSEPEKPEDEGNQGGTEGSGDTENSEDPGNTEDSGDTENSEEPDNTEDSDDTENIQGADNGVEAPDGDGTPDGTQVSEEQAGKEPNSHTQEVAKTGDTAQPYIVLGIMGAALVIGAAAVRKIKA